jgi:hypothetical protein
VFVVSLPVRALESAVRAGIEATAPLAAGAAAMPRVTDPSGAADAAAAMAKGLARSG